MVVNAAVADMLLTMRLGLKIVWDGWVLEGSFRFVIGSAVLVESWEGGIGNRDLMLSSIVHGESLENDETLQKFHESSDGDLSYTSL